MATIKNAANHSKAEAVLEMKKMIRDREDIIMDLIELVQDLMISLPGNLENKGEDWVFAWDELSDSSQTDINELAATAETIIEDIKERLGISGGDI